MNNLLTIFTPTYNRAALLPRLYESLKQQKLYNFEWVIVDDGSVDVTEEIVREFINASPFPIIYYQQNNQGKHIAINQGVQLAKNSLFFIVDSDDFLVADATDQIQKYYLQIQHKDEIAGVSFRRGYSETEVIGFPKHFDDFVANVFTFRLKKKISGDMAEVYKTEVLRNFTFPTVENEKFCAEGLIWNRIGLSYKLLWTSHLIYICNYLEGGLTDGSISNRKKSSTYATLYYSELSKSPISIKHKLIATINYWRFAAYQNVPFVVKAKRINVLNSLITLPLSLLFILKDIKK